MPGEAALRLLVRLVLEKPHMPQNVNLGLRCGVDARDAFTCSPCSQILST